jgi:ABC-type transport system involved in multi-copper enzyme maturation permease subunit
LGVVAAIARRELRLAWRRKVVRWLFLVSVALVLVFTTIVGIQVWGQQLGMVGLAYDPVAGFLSAQAQFLAFLAIALGLPAVATDRAEESLFLYATRPVAPWTYTAGKVLAVAIPSALLLAFPGALIAVVRLSLVEAVGFVDSAILCAKVVTAGLMSGAAMACVTVGVSSLFKQQRWGFLAVLLLITVPDGLAEGMFGRAAMPLGPVAASRALVDAWFGSLDASRGLWAAAVLLAWTVAGWTVTVARVRKEMVP